MSNPSADLTQRWARVKDVLDLVLDCDAAERDHRLSVECRDDPALRQEVEALLRFSGETGQLEDCLFKTVLEAGATDAIAPPARIGAYRIDRVLGSGGMGTVYLGIRDDGQLSARAAIKVMPAGGTEQLLQRFRLERQILAGLVHPYIARLLDAAILEDGRPCFVMEYVEGEPIHEYVARHQLDTRAILELFLKVCSAVQFAHQNLVVHRDLKAANILVTKTGDPRLLDFGIAKLLGEDTETTQPSERMLTPSSASPEQVQGGPITLASDVYSLGLLLYRLLTGVHPYEGAQDSSLEMSRVVLDYEPPSASSAAGVGVRLGRVLKGDLDNILQKALEKDPLRRYATVEAFAADLDRYLAGRPVAARPASLAYRAGKFVKRNRLAVTAGLLLAFTVAAGVGATLWYARQAHAEQIRAERQFNELRTLTHSSLFEFNDAIENLPGATAARALMIRRALEYLGYLSNEPIQDPLVLSDLADAYTRIAQIQGGFRSAHLGGSTRDALENLLKALAIRRRMLAQNPKDPTLQTKLSESLWSVAAGYTGAGDLDDALKSHLERLKMLELAASPEQRYSLAASLHSVGDIERALGNYETALSYHRRGLAVTEALLDADPGSARARRKVGISHEYLGYNLSSMKDFAAAAAEHRAALVQFEPIQRADPTNIDLRRLVAVAEENLCESMARSGVLGGAEGHCRAAIAIQRELVGADRNNVQALEDLASAEATLGLALKLADSMEQALVWEQRARTGFDAALGNDPDSLDLRQEDVESLIELAAIQAGLHQLTGARASAGVAKERLEQLIGRSPGNQDYRLAYQRLESLYGEIGVLK